jgi:hypothetical protein
MCKCHGMTGTCSTKTCVKKASGLRLIGNTIKAMLNRARKVEPENRQRPDLKLVLVDARKSSRMSEESPRKSELFYTEDSPSFCQRDDTLGIAGVSGRICSKDPSDVNSCRLMCCGQGYHEFWTREETNCECKFQYCCFVQCKKCGRPKWVPRCR